MKKSSLVLAVCLITGILASCGSKSGTGKKAAADSTGTKVFRIAAVDPQVPLDMQQNTFSIIMRLTDPVAESLLTTIFKKFSKIPEDA